MEEAALAEAAQWTRRPPAGRCGPLHGIPVTVKDVIDVAGAPTRAGSAAYLDVPAVDAVGVARLRAAGAIVLAKVHDPRVRPRRHEPPEPEPPRPVPHPRRVERRFRDRRRHRHGPRLAGNRHPGLDPGPGRLSGVVGFKPTYGSVPTDGVVPLSWTMDHVAPMARRRLPTPPSSSMSSPTGGRPTGWSTGWGCRWRGCASGCPEAAFVGAEPGVEACVRRMIDASRRLGVRCVRTRHPRPRPRRRQRGGPDHQPLRGGDLPPSPRHRPPALGEIADQLEAGRR